MQLSQRLQRISWRVAVSVLLLLAVAGVAWAQNGYNLVRYSTEYSGAVASGGGYTLTASIGQPDAGAASGGGFTLSSGFLTGAPGSLEEPDEDIFLPSLWQ